MAPRPLALLLALWATGAAPLPEGCEQELNQIKDLLQVSCVGRGITGPPSGLPPETGILLLSDNRLERLSLAAFGALLNLTELDVANNSLADLQPDAPLPALQHLGLASNALRNLPDLRGLPALRRLVLARNALASLPDGGFRALPALLDLELQGNRLRSLPSGAFAGLTQLRDLDLSDNQLEELPPALLEGLEALQVLRLERNRLRTVPDGFFQEHLFAYIYLRENPWRCDCLLRYLRDWISENELSVYTRQRGPHKETTEQDPEGVTCSAPPKQKGLPVMHFQAACRDPGDGGGASEEEDPTASSSPAPATTPARPSTAAPTALTSTAPTTTPVRLSTDAPTAPTSTAPTTAPGAPTPSSSPAPTTTPARPSTAAPTALTSTAPIATTTPVRLSTDASTAPTSTASTTTPGAPTPSSSPAPTTTPARPSTAAPTALTSTAPIATTTPVRLSTDASTAPTSTAPTTTPGAPSPPSSPAPTTTPVRLGTAAPTATLRPWLLPSTGGIGLLRSSPARPLWRGPSAPPARCLCPAVPVGALQAPTGRGSAVSPAGRLSALCCPLRLAVYASCLVLAGLPVLLGGCCWARAELSGRLPSPSPSRGLELGRVSACGAGRRGSEGTAGPVAGRRLYYVCKEFQLAPARHVAWLLVSLPGRRRPSRRVPSPSGVGGAGASAL